MAVKGYLVTIAGCGPGSPEYVTPAVRKAVEEADVLVGAERLLDLFPESRAECIPVKIHIEEILDEIEKKRENSRVTILVTGDPGLFSLARAVIARIGRDACRVIPGVSSLQAAFAALGLDWFDALIVDAHGSLPDIQEERLATAEKIAVFCGGKESRKWIATFGYICNSTHRMFLCSDLTLPEESIREVQPDALAEGLFPSLSIVILVRREILR